MSLQLLPEWCMLEEGVHTRGQHLAWVIYWYTNSIFHLYPGPGVFWWGKVPQVQPKVCLQRGQARESLLDLSLSLKNPSQICIRMSQVDLGVLKWHLERQQCQGPLFFCHLAGLYENHAEYTIFRVLSQGRWRKGLWPTPLFFLRENRMCWIFKKNIFYFYISPCMGGVYLSRPVEEPSSPSP